MNSCLSRLSHPVPDQSWSCTMPVWAARWMPFWKRPIAGTNRSRFFRGQVDKYTWVDLGSSYLPSEILAAFLYAQLERADQVQAKRRLIWENYQDQLQDWAQVTRIQPPFIPAHCEQSYHMFYMLFPTLESR